MPTSFKETAFVLNTIVSGEARSIVLCTAGWLRVRQHRMRRYMMHPQMITIRCSGLSVPRSQQTRRNLWSRHDFQTMTVLIADHLDHVSCTQRQHTNMLLHQFLPTRPSSTWHLRLTSRNGQCDCGLRGPSFFVAHHGPICLLA